MNPSHDSRRRTGDLPHDSGRAPLLASLREALRVALGGGGGEGGVDAPGGAGNPRDPRDQWATAPLEPLPTRGLAHDHVRLVGTGLLARIPRQSQLGLDAETNLAYQAACFRRAGAGMSMDPATGSRGPVPRLHAVLPPSPGLPRGALLVQEITGRPAALPQDLRAIVQALARLHALPLPPREQRPPLLDPDDALGALHDEIAAQARHLDAARVHPAVHAIVRDGLQALQEQVRGAARPPLCLVAYDGHPGNFVVRADGQAVLVDLEKCRYSHAGLDLAHATLYTSTTWDTQSHAVLDADQVRAACRDWAEAMREALDQGAGKAYGQALVDAALPWHVPLRRAMWLWSLTWCAKWRVLSAGRPRADGDGEDWSAANSDAALVRHVRERVDHYLDADVVQRIARGIDALALGGGL